MKKIVLINVSVSGHHLSFARTFSKILLEQGYKVCCAISEPGKVENWVAVNCREKISFFSTASYQAEINFGQGGKYRHTLQVLKRWKQDAGIIRKIEKESGEKTDFVFYAYVDYQLAQYIPAFLLNRIFPWKWGGLYFHPYHLRQTDLFLNRKAVWRDMDTVFLSKNCVAVALHDAEIVEKFSKRIGKPVIHFAETADDTPPDTFYPLAIQIREKAKGRTVAGMIGCEKHKGTLTLIRAAKQADAQKYFFVFAGILPEHTYSNEEWNEVQQFIHSSPENCFFHFEPIPEGAAYNAVFSSFDIIYLVYDNFISSSNRLTKAAIFQRLVLASDQYCVGDDVRNFNLGVAIPPKKPEAVLQGLDELRCRMEKKEFPYEQWKHYAALNSEEKLAESFRQMLSLLQ
jgi:hypothetical protein